MKLSVLLSILLLAFGCTADLKNAQSIIDESISAHGGDILESRKVYFDFRDKSYSVVRNDSGFIYTRSFMDSAGYVRDVLVNSTEFSRKIDEYDVQLSEEWKGRYGNSVNSVLYFFQVPYVLNDPAANKTLTGDVTINGEPYDIIKIDFAQEGGGKDFEDEFRYWIHKETNLIDYLAYNYITDGGGTRFRQAINRRSIKGLVVQDYINYKPSEKFPPLDDLPGLFEKDSLEELSRIINTNVRIEEL